jgi:lipopolysaccharide export system permease protein
MQFLWRYVEDLVGKGLDNAVLAELFLYAALQLIPMALPLSLLLASLMAFGNMGERLELLAIKASGVSLLKAMSPLIILVSLIAIGAFFFQNEAMPRVNVKFRSLFLSIRQKSPELDIPEGAFFNGVKGYSMYVKKKNIETKMLYGLKIYDTSKGFDNMSIIVCDSGIMQVSEDKKFLLFTLFSGQHFSNAQQNEDRRRNAQNNKFIPYARENFKKKDIIIQYDTGFDRMDEANLEGTYVSKNIVQLENSIDSMNMFIDSLNVRDRETMTKKLYLTYRDTEEYRSRSRDSIVSSQAQITSSTQKERSKSKEKAKIDAIDFDSLLHTYSNNEMSQYLMTAASEAENNNQSINIFDTTQKARLQKDIRYHQIEWHRKYTLSFACLIFFFIGAPLGAIIRKGGLGMPVVVSVCLFIVYYIIDNVGYKFARDAIWEVWQGIWLSSAVLFPLGVFLTYKAMNDSTLFNPEAYGKFFRKALFIKPPARFTDEDRMAIMEKIPTVSELEIREEMIANLEAMDSDKLRDLIPNYEKYNYDKEVQLAALSILKGRGAELNDIIDKQNSKYINEVQALYNQSSILSCIGYIAFIVAQIINLSDFTWIFNIGYLLLFIRSMTYYQLFYKDIKNHSRLYYIAVLILSLIAYPVVYLHVRKQMDKDKKEVEIITI